MQPSPLTTQHHVHQLFHGRCPLVHTQLWKEHSERMMSGTCSDIGRLAKAVEETSAALGGKAGVMEVGAALSSKADVADMDERLRDKVGGCVCQSVREVQMLHADTQGTCECVLLLALCGALGHSI